MVYIGNIVEFQEELEDDHVIQLNYKSGAIGYIFPSDNCQRKNGDLLVKSVGGIYATTKLIDCAEVESIIIKDKEMI